MAREDARVRVVEDRCLDAPAEQLLRLAHEVLVERVLGRDEHREAVAASARAAPLLAQRRDRSRKADRDHRVEQADVDPELERVGRGDPEQVALGEAPLDLAALLDGVARAVGREPRVVAEPVGREAVDQLGRLAALGEGERAKAALDECRLELRSLRERRSAQPELDIEQRRVPEDDGALGAGRCVVPDHRHRRPEQRLAELARVRDRGRGEQELRLGAVDRRDPAKAPQHVGDVRSEHAAVDVRLVDDDVAEVREHLAPALVVREQPDVDHVRVGQDRVRPLADLPALVGRGVAVVDRRPQLRDAQRGQRAELVLRERLRRVQVEHTVLGRPHEVVEDRQVERERLAGRGAGGDHEVLAPRGRVPRGALVGVELRNADRRPDAWVELVRERCRSGLARGLVGAVGELLSCEQLLRQNEACARHSPMLASPHRGARWG